MSGVDRNAGPKRPVERILTELSRLDHGVFTYEDAVARGITKYQLQRRIDSGVLARPHPKVFVLRAVAPSWEQRAIAALKWIGPHGAVSHRSAAKVWRLLDVADTAPLELSSRRDLRSGRRDVVVRQKHDLRRTNICVHKRLRVTTPGRTVVDLASVCDHEQMRTVVEEGLVAGSIDLRRLRRHVETTGTRGRKGMARLAALIEELDGSKLLPRSRLERRYINASKKANLVLPVLQMPVEAGGNTYFIDFAYPEHMLAVEMDGWRFHGGRRKWEADIHRSNALVAQGWRVVRGTWRDLQECPQTFIDRVRLLLMPELPGVGGAERN